MVNLFDLQLKEYADLSVRCSPNFHFLLSLANVSDEIRWSLDLRWQRPDCPVGFYDLKEGVLMRTTENPDMAIDWDKFDGVDRHTASVQEMKKKNLPVSDEARQSMTARSRKIQVRLIL